MDLELQLTNDKKIIFKQHRNFKNSVYATIKLDNGYIASIITRKPFEKNNGALNSAQGSWDNMTFELAVLNKDEAFIQLQELNEDPVYSRNYGVWTYLSKNELLEKIHLISTLKANI